jgi:tetratricopeptide (TPR) repeat protein
MYSQQREEEEQHHSAPMGVDFRPIRFQHAPTQQFWTSLNKVNLPKTRVYDLYWYEFIPIQSKSSDEKRQIKEEMMKRMANGYTGDFMTRLLLQFGILYVDEETNATDKIVQLTNMIQELELHGLAFSNFAVLCYNNRARSYHDVGMYNNANLDYSKCISINGSFASAYYNRAITKDTQHNYRGAIADYTKAIEINPRYSRAYNNRGICHNSLREYDNAIEDYSKAIEIDHAYVKAWNNRAISYYVKENYLAALSDTMKAVELDPHYSNAHFNQGLCYRSLDLHVLALRSFSKALETKNGYDDLFLKTKAQCLNRIHNANNRI